MTHHRKPRRAPVGKSRVLPGLAAPADTGCDGPAQLARRSYRVPSDTAGLEYVQMADPGPLQGLRLEGRHLEAAEALRRLWRASLAGMVTPPGFRHGVSSEDATDEAAAAAAYRDYNAAIDAVQWQVGLRPVAVLRAVVIHHEPTREPGTLRLALDALALHFRL